MESFLEQALSLAKKAQGKTAPNPSVGAVLVRENEVISEGYHLGPGHPHAEVEAILRAPRGTEFEKTSLYVSLEPCNHFGRTPPCTHRILETKIPKVFFGYHDPNPAVAGKGQEFLRDHGVECSHLPHEAITRFYRSYHRWSVEKQPWVSLKLAMSLDGKISAQPGTQTFLTGKEAKTFTHVSRLHSDAILTTINTVLSDDPQMNVRLEATPLAKPVFVLDSRARLPLTSALLQTASELTVFHSLHAPTENLLSLKSAGVRLVPTAGENGTLALVSVFEKVAGFGVHDLWVEAGGILSTELLRQQLVQTLHLIIAPMWLGQKDTDTPTIRPQLQLEAFKKASWRFLGNDALCTFERSL